MPDRIIDVALPAGEPIHVAVAGANKFGDGGALQIQLAREPIGWEKVATWVTNDRPL